MDGQKRRVLRRIAEAMDAGGVLWAVGGSMLLHLCGLTDTVHDIDLMVAEADVAKADALLSAMGARERRPAAPPYATEYFYEYTVEGVEVDVMRNFAVRGPGVDYRFSLDGAGIGERRAWEGAALPLARLEDWYVLYQVMPGREAKVRLAENGLAARGTADRSRFALAVENGLPAGARARIEGRFGPLPPRGGGAA